MTTLGPTTVRCPGCGEPVVVDLTVVASETRDREVVLTIDGKAISRQIEKHLTGSQHG